MDKLRKYAAYVMYNSNDPNLVERVRNGGRAGMIIGGLIGSSAGLTYHLAAEGIKKITSNGYNPLNYFRRTSK